MSSATRQATSSSRRVLSNLDKALDHLEVAFISWGKAGANHDVTHPLREPWLRAREVLVAAGRIK